MLRSFLLFLSTLLIQVGFANADPAADIQAAVAKLVQADNYSWHTVSNGRSFFIPISAPPGMAVPAHDLAGDTWSETFDGKTRKDGLSLIAAGSDGEVFSVVISSGNGLIKSAEGWKSPHEFLAALPQKRNTFDAAIHVTRWMNDFHTPAETVQRAAGRIQNIRPADGGYLCDVPVPATPGQSETQSIQFWIKDGLLTKFEIHCSGSNYEMGFESTDTTDISNVGSTAVELPGDAKAKLDSMNSQGKKASPAAGG